MLYPELTSLCDQLSSAYDSIAKERRLLLNEVASSLQHIHSKYSYLRVVAVCTHNSRRSQALQLWLKTAAAYYGIEELYTYSGGTEVTEFNPLMLAAIERQGFLVEHFDHFANAKYHIPISAEDYSYDLYYSKKYNESYNPQNAYVALIVCDHAAAQCPTVDGALERHLLPYPDPGESDQHPHAITDYNKILSTIATEALYLCSKINR